jgi:hypothetical protein
LLTHPYGYSYPGYYPYYYGSGYYYPPPRTCWNPWYRGYYPC